MSRWWRAYDEAMDDPKLLLLSDRAHRAWFNLMCLASANGGSLPSMEVICLKLRLSPAKVAASLKELTAQGLLDECDGSLHPHNWNARQYKSDVSTERVKRFRKHQRNVSVTPPETERKKDAASAAPIDPDADLFRRGEEVLGKGAGSLIARLKKAKNGSIPHTRSVIEQASTKHNPREYVGAVLRGAAEQQADFYSPTAGII